MNKKFLMIAIALSINAAKADSIPQIINPRFEAEYNANGVADADGIFMAAATRCGLPSAPFDAHLDRYIKDHGIEAPQASRLKARLAASRSQGAPDYITCDAVKKELQEDQESVGTPKKGGRR